MPRATVPERLPSVVRALRIRKGLTQSELAQRGGVVDATISRIERGRLHPSTAVIRRLAAALEVSVESLVDGGSPPPESTARPSIARLVAIADALDDAVVDDITRGLKLLLAAGRRSGARE
jgi:hypothetical protein